MLTKTSARIDRFYLILVIVLSLLTALTILSFLTVFGALNSAREIDEQVIGDEQIKKDVLNKAYEFVFDKKISPLDLGK